MIRCFLSEGQEDWDCVLPQLAGAIRGSVNRQTGFSANTMMLGRDVWNPIDIMAVVADVNQQGIIHVIMLGNCTDV